MPPRFLTFLSRRRSRLPKPRPNQPTTTTTISPKEYMRTTIHKITSLLRTNDWSSAQHHLSSLPIKWDSFTINRVLKTHPPMQKAFLFFNWVAARPNFKHDRFTYTTMLDIFGEAGRLTSMHHLFDEMCQRGIEPDGATYTVIMHWIAKSGDFEGAIRVWGEMRRRRCRPTVVSYTALIKVLFKNGQIEEAKEVYKQMIEEGIEPNCHTYTVLMDHLASAGKFDAILEMMNEMKEAGVEPDKAMYNILIEKSSNSGEVKFMNKILECMKERKMVLRFQVFAKALEALNAKGESDFLLREVNPHIMLDEKISENNMDNDYMINKGIIIYLLGSNNWIALARIITEISDKELDMDLNILTMVIQTSCAKKNLSCALAVYKYFIKNNKEIEISSFNSIFGLLVRNKMFDVLIELFEEMISARYIFGPYLGFLLINSLGYAGYNNYATRVFTSFLSDDRNIVTYTALMDCYFHNGEVDKGIEVLEEMKTNGIEISCGTYDVIVSGLRKAGWVSHSEYFRKEKKKVKWRGNMENVSCEEMLCNRLFCLDQGLLDNSVSARNKY